MLAGEPFTDHPASVCPVIGSFLRAYNDSIDDRRRQALYEYASRVVGSRGPPAHPAGAGRPTGALGRRDASDPPDLVLLRSPLRALGPPAPAADRRNRHLRRARHSQHTDETHAAVLALIDELLVLGVRDDRVSARVIAARARTLDPAA